MSLHLSLISLFSNVRCIPSFHLSIRVKSCLAEVKIIQIFIDAVINTIALYW